MGRRVRRRKIEAPARLVVSGADITGSLFFGGGAGLLVAVLLWRQAGAAVLAIPLAGCLTAVCWLAMEKGIARLLPVAIRRDKPVLYRFFLFFVFLICSIVLPTLLVTMPFDMIRGQAGIDAGTARRLGELVINWSLVVAVLRWGVVVRRGMTG